MRTIFNGDCRHMDLPDEYVQMAVTSPPYWGLRKYSGLQDLIWGDSECEHEKADYSATESNKQGAFCSLCGAWKGQYGLEPTPELYIDHTIEILREIRRVLRKDGVVFWNIGDSYNGSTPNQSGNHGYKDGRSNRDKRFSVGGIAGLKPKDLCLIPFRVAIAAQEDGWWVRSVIIWSKPNPMPESVRDRPTESHEYILMLTKSSRYYFDQEAVREPYPQSTVERMRYPVSKTNHGENWVTTKDNPGRELLELHPVGRNIRSVWEFPTQPYPEAHFAVFPEKLPELCIKAASKEGDIVLDPFMGSGTTLEVAAYLGRRSVGYELSKEYCDLAIKRNQQGVMI